MALYAPAISEEEHTAACQQGDHTTRFVNGSRYDRECTTCEHPVNRFDIAVPHSDCPDSCFDRYAEEL